MIKAINYSGFTTHPAQDSSSTTLGNGIMVINHYIEQRQRYVLAQLALVDSATSGELAALINDKYRKNGHEAGYTASKIAYALERLRRDYGLVKCEKGRWMLVSPNAKARNRAKFENAKKRTTGQ